MAGRRGFKQFEKFKYEDGSEHLILFESETSLFHCNVEGQNMHDSDLNKLKGMVIDKLDLTRSLNWEPLITTEARKWNDYELDFERIFRASKADGSVVYKDWAGTYDKDKQEWDDEKGEPGRDKSLSDEAEIFPYTNELWKALGKIKDDLEEFRLNTINKVAEKKGADFALRYLHGKGKIEIVYTQGETSGGSDSKESSSPGALSEINRQGGSN